MSWQEAHSNNIERDKLFLGICLALLPTAFSFILVSDILHQLKTEFILTNAGQTLSYDQTNGKFEGNATGNALRALIDSGIDQEEDLITRAHQVLRPSDNYGGRMAFLWVAPISLLSGIVFIVWFIKDKRRGGYQVERLEKRELRKKLKFVLDSLISLNSY